jgi:glucokinase
MVKYPAMTDLFLGVDLGGTNVKIGVCTAAGEIRGSVSLPTEAARGPQDAIDRMGAAAEKLMQKTGRARACGSGVPGPLDLERTVLFVAVNMPGWKDVPYPRMLGDRLGIRTFMENDANCAAWGEYICGAGQGTRSLVLYTLGTGVGGGIIIDGDLWVGASGAAGELGHMTIEIDGLKCGCGQLGCVEQYASASALSRRWGKGSAKECFDAARRGDPDALAAIDGSADALAIGLANMIHVLHPEIIVLAGGMAAAGDMLFDRVRAGVRRRVFPVCLEKIRIEPSKISGDDAGWLGAALWGARKVGAYAIREPTR